MTGYADDIEAINVYFMSYDLNNLPIKARRLWLSWVEWYRTLTPIAKNLYQNIWVEALRRRTEFNSAKGTPESFGGMTSEVMYPAGVPGAGVANTVTGAGSAVAQVAKQGLDYGTVALVGLAGIAGIYLLIKR
jgi:hypothetical protein